MKRAPLRVDKIWAVIAVDSDGDEALVTTRDKGVPMVCVNPDHVDDLRNVAEDFQKQREGVAFVREFVMEDNPGS